MFQRSSGVRGAAALLVVATVLTACTTTAWDTSESDSATTVQSRVYFRDEAGVIDSISDHLSKVGPNLNEWAPPADQARCAAEKIVAKVGIERLFAMGFDPQDGKMALTYTPAEQASVLNVMVGCIDFAQGFLEMWTAYDKLDLKRTACLTQTLDRDGLVRDLASGLLIGREPDQLASESRVGLGVVQAMSECLDSTVDLVPGLAEDPFPQDNQEDNAPTTVKGRSATTTTVK